MSQLEQPLLDEETPQQLLPLLGEAEVWTEAHPDDTGLRVDHIPLPRHGNTFSQTIVLFIGVYVGLGLLSQPYALAEGGWAALPLLFGCCGLFATSAYLVGKSLEHLPPGASKSFPSLGMAIAQEQGRSWVGGLACFELFGGSSIVLLVIWEQLELLLPSHGVFGLPVLSDAIVMSVFILVPLIALPDLSKISKLSIFGALSSAIVILSVVALPLLVDPTRSGQPHQPPAGRDVLLWPGALKAIGILSVSMSGHSSIPSIANSMKTPLRFSAAVWTSFAIMAVLYSTTAAAGYWYFGRASSPLVTTDLCTNSPYMTWGPTWFGVDNMLEILVLVNCLAKLPALLMVLQDVGLGLMNLPLGLQPRRRTLFGVRLLLAISCGVVAFLGRNVLGNVISLVGGICSMSTSLILPVTFYSCLRWKALGKVQRGGLVGMAILGMVLLGMITYSNVRQMITHA